MRDLDRHLDRLERLLAAVAIPMPTSRAALRGIVRETLRRNRLPAEAVVYIQVDRGAAPRNHAFPKNARPSLIVTARRARFPSRRNLPKGSALSRCPTSAGSAATSNR